jgi:hypothetical protein
VHACRVAPESTWLGWVSYHSMVSCSFRCCLVTTTGNHVRDTCTVCARRQLQNIRRLQLLSINWPLAQSGDTLDAIKQMTQLSSLELSYASPAHAVVDGKHWVTLPKITALGILITAEG